MESSKPSRVQDPRYIFAFKLGIDILFWLISTPLAFWMRFDWSLSPDFSFSVIALTTLGFIALKLGAYFLFNLHLQSWTKFAFADMSAVIKAVVSVAFFSTLILLWVAPTVNYAASTSTIARSLGGLDALITLLFMFGVRWVSRYWRETRLGNTVSDDRRKRVLVIGAGEAGSLVVREMLRHPETGLKPVGFLDDNRRKVGQQIASVPVLGTSADLERTLKEQDIDEVLIAIPSAEGKVVRNIVNRINATKSNVKYRTIPGVYELLTGKISINRIRDVEIEDLLRRPSIKLDMDKILGYIEGKTIMVTGAGGSIGSEIVRQVCRFRPKEIILFGHGENSIYNLERELDRDWPDIAYTSVIGALQNGVRLDYVFRHYKPQVVFHTAAHKHVPLMEANPEEAVFNNIIGSKNLVNLALKYNVSHFVNISTDKAVNPTSVMGASKRMVEYIVQDASRRAKDNQQFVSVRFGNVLGSRGSVIPVFKQQIAAGGPVTVTHPDMVRYFMTIPEASQLVLQASGQGKNGEIYILDMGEPVKIVDLARDLIKLSGLEPDVDIPIVFSGMRPGEKLFEELMTNEERTASTNHEKIFVAKVQPFSSEELENTIARLQDAALNSDHAGIRRGLEGFVEGCQFNYKASVRA
jgi:FlaA1/EpsC-like NDP-sugar epimerase